MRTELWLSQLHRLGAKGGAPPVGEYYDLLFEVSAAAAAECSDSPAPPYFREAEC